MPHTSPNFRRSVAFALILLLLVQVTGCASWQPVAAPTPAALTEGNPAKFRITFRDGRVLERRVLGVRNDSLFIPPEYLHDGATPPPLEIFALADIATIEKRGHDNAAPFLAGALVLIGLATAAAAGGVSSSGTISLGGSSGSLSCPLVYSWDGSGYRLDSGTFGGAIMPALARTDVDNLMHIRPAQGVLRFLMTAEQPETEYVDQFDLIAVDHRVNAEVIPDGRANGALVSVESLRPPRHASDRLGRDVVSLLAAADGHDWSTPLATRNPDDTASHRDGVDVSFARPAGDAVVLVVDGRNTNWSAFLMGQLVHAKGRGATAWYQPANTAAAAWMRTLQEREGALAVTAWDGTAWRSIGTVWEAGPEVTKRQALVLDIHGITTPELRIRLDAAAASWSIDRVALGVPSVAPIRTRSLSLTRAIDDAGNDRRGELATADRRHVVMERGDTVRLEVRDDEQPPAPGHRRSYLVRTHGWYRIHGRDRGEPDHHLLARLASPQGAARISLEWFNRALEALSVGVSADD